MICIVDCINSTQCNSTIHWPKFFITEHPNLDWNVQSYGNWLSAYLLLLLDLKSLNYVVNNVLLLHCSYLFVMDGLTLLFLSLLERNGFIDDYYLYVFSSFVVVYIIFYYIVYEPFSKGSNFTGITCVFKEKFNNFFILRWENT